MKKQPELQRRPPPSLDGIITEYLREQHARCPNPVTTCPPFSLYTPHRCPEPQQRRRASSNFTARLGGRVLHPKYGGVDRAGLDRHLIFSRSKPAHVSSGSVPPPSPRPYFVDPRRFRPMTVFHEGDGDESGFTCCAFAARERFLMLGTCFGHLNLFDVSSGAKVADYTCHTSAITHLEPSRVGPAAGGPPRLPHQDPLDQRCQRPSGPKF